MLLPSKDGIRCDTCGMIHKHKFTYYSCAGTGYKATKHANGSSSSKNGAYLDFDMCESCYFKYKKQVRDNIVSAQPNKIKDDFSKNFYDEADWMRIILTRVEVNKEADGGIEGTEEDIDMVLVDKSLKDFIKNMIAIKKMKPKEEDGSWSMK